MDNIAKDIIENQSSGSAREMNRRDFLKLSKNLILSGISAQIPILPNTWDNLEGFDSYQLDLKSGKSTIVHIRRGSNNKPIIPNTQIKLTEIRDILNAIVIDKFKVPPQIIIDNQSEVIESTKADSGLVIFDRDAIQAETNLVWIEQLLEQLIRIEKVNLLGEGFENLLGIGERNAINAMDGVLLESLLSDLFRQNRNLLTGTVEQRTSFTEEFLGINRMFSTPPSPNLTSDEQEPIITIEQSVSYKDFGKTLFYNFLYAKGWQTDHMAHFRHYLLQNISLNPNVVGQVVDFQRLVNQYHKETYGEDTAKVNWGDIGEIVANSLKQTIFQGWPLPIYNIDIDTIRRLYANYPDKEIQNILSGDNPVTIRTSISYSNEHLPVGIFFIPELSSVKYDFLNGYIFNIYLNEALTVDFASESRYQVLVDTIIVRGTFAEADEMKSNYLDTDIKIGISGNPQSEI